jgi:hypothetical protein
VVPQAIEADTDSMALVNDVLNEVEYAESQAAKIDINDILKYAIHHRCHESQLAY